MSNHNQIEFNYRLFQGYTPLGHLLILLIFIISLAVIFALMLVIVSKKIYFKTFDFLFAALLMDPSYKNQSTGPYRTKYSAFAGEMFSLLFIQNM